MLPSGAECSRALPSATERCRVLPRAPELEHAAGLVRPSESVGQPAQQPRQRGSSLDCSGLGTQPSPQQIVCGWVQGFDWARCLGQMRNVFIKRSPYLSTCDPGQIIFARRPLYCQSMHAQLRCQSDVEHRHVMVRLNHGQKNGTFSFFPCAWNFLRLPKAY